jgi:hypothetical protein
MRVRASFASLARCFAPEEVKIMGDTPTPPAGRCAPALRSLNLSETRSETEGPA